MGHNSDVIPNCTCEPTELARAECVDSFLGYIMQYYSGLLGPKHQVANTSRIRDAVTMGTRCWSFSMQSTTSFFRKTISTKINALKILKALYLIVKAELGKQWSKTFRKPCFQKLPLIFVFLPRLVLGDGTNFSDLRFHFSSVCPMW